MVFTSIVSSVYVTTNISVGDFLLHNNNIYGIKVFRKQIIQIIKQKHYLKAPNVYFKEVVFTTSIVSGVYVVAEISIISQQKIHIKSCIVKTNLDRQLFACFGQFIGYVTPETIWRFAIQSGIIDFVFTSKYVCSLRKFYPVNNTFNSNKNVYFLVWPNRYIGFYKIAIWHQHRIDQVFAHR